MAACRALLCSLLLSAGVSFCSAASVLQADAANKYVGRTDVHVNLQETTPVSDLLYGVFFEEIQHSGEGGIYAEQIQDRSFEGLAWTTGFHQSGELQRTLGPEAFADSSDVGARHEAAAGKGLSEVRQEAARGGDNTILPQRPNSQPQSWEPLSGTQAQLTKEEPLNDGNPTAMRLTTQGPKGGIVNTGYWGIGLAANHTYALSVFLKYTHAEPEHNRTVRVALESADSQTTYASATFSNVSNATWERYYVNLTSCCTDTRAQLRLSFPGPGELLMDVLSIFPVENLRPGLLNPYPLRKDITDYVKALGPRFLRIPGGCVVEGDTLALRFQWKKALGNIAERPGHWDIWGYWNTDGLGMFEYLQMADALDAIPIWIANNGVAHNDEVAPRDIGPWIQDALDSLEFAMGPANSTWGKVRAAMGREEPWDIPYFGIGNEDCGHPFYVANYVAFYFALREAYPNMKLIANCDLGQDAPTDMWDWHLYTNSWSMFKAQDQFDHQVPGVSPLIFASEYAVVDDSGHGNLKGALAEAAVMMAMEKHSEIVRMAAYAPLLVNENDHWYWTNLICFNNTEVYGIPSYWVQKVFSEVQGVRYAATGVASDQGLVHTERVAAGTTCQDEACTQLAVKIVNTAGMPQLATVFLAHSTRFLLHGAVNATLITGEFPEIENTLDSPHNVYPQEEVLHLTPQYSAEGASLQVSLPANSLTVLRLDVHYQSGPAEALAASSSLLSHLALV